MSGEERKPDPTDPEDVRARSVAHRLLGGQRPPMTELPLTATIRARRPNAEMYVSVEMLRTMFDLPPEYQWQSTRPDGKYAFQFYVEHLPDIGPFDRPHLLQPTYKVVRAGMVELDSMRVIPSTDRGR